MLKVADKIREINRLSKYAKLLREGAQNAEAIIRQNIKHKKNLYHLYKESPEKVNVILAEVRNLAQEELKLMTRVLIWIDASEKKAAVLQLREAAAIFKRLGMMREVDNLLNISNYKKQLLDNFYTNLKSQLSSLWKKDLDTFFKQVDIQEDLFKQLTRNSPEEIEIAKIAKDKLIQLRENIKSISPVGGFVSLPIVTAVTVALYNNESRLPNILPDLNFSIVFVLLFLFVIGITAHTELSPDPLEEV